jgi:hypothetical protein
MGDLIEAKVIATLRKLDDGWQSVGSRDASWTRAVKNAVGRVGKSLGYRVYGAQCEFEANGEWLFDLSWIEERRGIVVDIPLVLESEWDPRGILDDFQKILVSRAAHRVLVCWQPTPQAWKHCENQLLNQIERYRGTQKDDRYLLCCWVGSQEKLEKHVAA